MSPGLATRRAHGPATWWAGLLCALCLKAVALAASGAAEPEVSVVETDQTLQAVEVLAGGAGTFRPASTRGLAVGGDPDRTWWVRVVPAAGMADPVLWVERSAIGSLRLHPGNGGAVQEAAFFAPSGSDPLLFGAFVFEPGAVRPGSPLLLEIRGASEVPLTLRLKDRREAAAEDRFRALMFSALYAVLTVLALLSLASHVALRDASWLGLAAFASASLLALLGHNGHLYALPFNGLLGPLGAGGLLALYALLGAAILLLTRQFLALERVSLRLSRAFAVALYSLLALAVVASLVPQAAMAGVQWSVRAGLAASVLMALWASVAAMRLAQPLGRPLLVVWLGVAVLGLLAALAGWGLVADNLLTRYGGQFGLTAAGFLFAMAQADRMIEFRRSRDRSRQDKVRADADLKVEQVRRRFVEELHTGMRGADTSDVEWLAFRRLLESVRTLMPQQGAAVIAFGYHGLDLLLAEPLGLQKEYTRLLSRRGPTIKGLCRSRKAVPLTLEEIALDDGSVVPGGVFAVVPLQIPKPGWGVLLVRREDGSGFEPGELQLLSEFAQAAVHAADEAAAAVDLRRRAELDPLTGALNRRAMDGRLAASVERAHAERRPLAVLFADIDHFKQVNDRHGHAVGDDCLRMASDCIRRHLGKDDLFGRYGGEEFIIVLPDRTPDQARELAEKIRQALAKLVVVGEVNVSFTASIGLASRLPSEKRPGPIVERADKALYQAKRGGRNRVQVAATHGLGAELGEVGPY
ncbi:MAG: diguanylate cyclase [Lysobacteraceae bacterium]